MWSWCYGTPFILFVKYLNQKWFIMIFLAQYSLTEWLISRIKWVLIVTDKGQLAHAACSALHFRCSKQTAHWILNRPVKLAESPRMWCSWNNAVQYYMSLHMARQWLKQNINHSSYPKTPYILFLLRSYGCVLCGFGQILDMLLTALHSYPLDIRILFLE